MICKPYGFLIDNVIHIDIMKNCIYRYNTEEKADEMSIGVLYITETMMCLFSYLLTHARNRFVTKEEVLKHVWDEHNLSSSGTRLWQVFTNLKNKLSLLNLPDNLMEYEKRKGYTIKHENIMTLYYKEAEKNDLTALKKIKPRRSSMYIHLHQKPCHCVLKNTSKDRVKPDY